MTEDTIQQQKLLKTMHCQGSSISDITYNFKWQKGQLYFSSNERSIHWMQNFYLCYTKLCVCLF